MGAVVKIGDMIDYVGPGKIAIIVLVLQICRAVQLNAKGSIPPTHCTSHYRTHGAALNLRAG